MAERDRIESIVERIVGEVLTTHTVRLREEIVQRVAEDAANWQQPAPTVVKGGADSAELARSVAEIHAGSNQREILKGLLDCCARYAARVALFVVKSGSATGWQGRGFADNDGLKDFVLDVNASAVSRAIGEHSVVQARADEMDGRFLEQFGAPGGEGRLLPLLLKDKVAALVYADGGSEGGLLDAGALDLLVLATSSWLEVNSLRKQAQKGPAAATEAEHSYSSSAPAAAGAYSDPFAGHTPTHAMAAAAGVEAAASTLPSPAQAQAATVEAGPALGAARVAQTAPGAAPSGEEQEVIRKAQRFARLLIDEIKLYNQARVAEGRKNKDLYERLKEPIEKSRVTYQKRYGNTFAGSNDYFQHELVRSLAEDDISLMGANFPR